jgi:hypothetical protein
VRGGHLWILTESTIIACEVLQKERAVRNIQLFIISEIRKIRLAIK